MHQFTEIFYWSKLSEIKADSVLEFRKIYFILKQEKRIVHGMTHRLGIIFQQPENILKIKPRGM